MPLSDVPKSANSGVIRLSDGTTPTAVSLIVSWANGDFDHSEIADVLNEVEAVEVRGKFKGLVTAGRIYPTFSFTAVAVEFTNASAGALADFILKRGGYAANKGTLGDGQPYTIDCAIGFDGEVFGDDDDHQVIFRHCRCRIKFAEGSTNTFSVSGTCYGEIGGDMAVAEIA
jgi:hypothetical protein